MKLIQDSAAVNMKDSVQIHPNRLFHCDLCKLNITRIQVRKAADGTYHCPRCDSSVTDITNTTTGQDIVTFLGL